MAEAEVFQMKHVESNQLPSQLIGRHDFGYIREVQPFITKIDQNENNQIIDGYRHVPRHP